MKTKILSLPELPPEREQRLYYILGLHDRGLTTKEISSLLNISGMISPRGGLYTPKLVWVTIKKFKNRLERLTNTTVEVGAAQFYLRQLMRKPWKKVVINGRVGNSPSSIPSPSVQPSRLVVSVLPDLP